MTVELNKETLKTLMGHCSNYQELFNVMKARMLPMKAEEMVHLLMLFDEIDNEQGNAPDSDFVESLAKVVGTESNEIERFWKYLAMGDYDGDWEE